MIEELPISKPLLSLGEKEADLASDLMTAFAFGLGPTSIAAVEVGVPVRMVAVLQDGVPTVAVNPRITSRSKKTAYVRERVARVLGLEVPVHRSTEVTVVFQALDGSPTELTASGQEALDWQRVVDALDGKTALDRVSAYRRKEVLRRWRKRRP